MNCLPLRRAKFGVLNEDARRELQFMGTAMPEAYSVDFDHNAILQNGRT